MSTHSMALRFTLTLLAAAITAVAAAQETQRPWEGLFADISILDDMESAEWESTYEMLCELEQEPLDINTATREQLLQLPFLNDKQVEDIHIYIDRFGTMKSTGELAMITSLDYTTRCLLSYFVCCKEPESPAMPDWQKVMKYGRHSVTATANIPFYERRGDKEGYLGYPYRHSLRYRFHYSDRLKIGFLGAQDAGEPFFANKNGAGYDFYAFYAEAHRIGRLKTIVAGRYRASFGMGLVMSNDFSMGKLAALYALGQKGYGLRAHTSRSQANYLQGAAATVTLARGLDISALVSYRKTDATLNHGDSCIASLDTDGYHRTVSEMGKKNNTSETLAGAHLHFRRHGFHLGATGSFTSYSKDLAPATTPLYRRYYPSGNDFWNIGADYGYTGHLVSLHGETATGGCGAIATIHSLSLTPSSQWTLLAVQRFYGKKYYSMHANSLSEGGRVQNESGIYIGAQWQPLKRLRLTAYTDYAYFAGAKYQAQQASHAWDHLIQAQYDHRQLSVTARYRLKRREYDNTDATALATKTTHRARLSATLNRHSWRFTTTADAAHSSFEESSTGWMLTQQVGYRRRALQLNATLAYFHTDDNESRLYGYEPGTLYTFAYQAFAGEGFRYALTARADIASRLTLIAHLATTDYLDRDHIASGLQQIDRSSKTDLELQLRWNF